MSNDGFATPTFGKESVQCTRSHDAWRSVGGLGKKQTICCAIIAAGSLPLRRLCATRAVRRICP